MPVHRGVHRLLPHVDAVPQHRSTRRKLIPQIVEDEWNGLALFLAERSADHPSNDFAQEEFAVANGFCSLTPAAERLRLSQQSSAFEIEVEANFAQTGMVHNPSEPCLLLGVKHEEAPASGSNQLPA